MTTIKDVARKAGVSVSTVSLAINHKQGVSDEVLSRVEAAMRELHYRPNISAQNLRRNRFHIIGVVLPYTDGYYAQILQGIYDALDTAGTKYNLILKLSENREKAETEQVEELIAMSVSGILMVPCAGKDSAKYREWSERSVPIVFLERYIADVGISSVLFKNREIVYRRTRELLERYRPDQLILITGNSVYSSERDSIQGFLDAMEELEEAPPKEELHIVEANFEWRRSVWHVLNSFGRMDDMPRCVITTSGRFAMILNETSGISHYDMEIHVLGGDILFRSRRPGSGVVEIPRKAIRMGEEATRLLLNEIGSEKITEVETITIDSDYPAREYSEAPGAANGKKDRLKALFFRTNEMEVLEKLARNFSTETGIDLDVTYVPFNEASRMLTGDPKEIAGFDLLWVDIPLVDILARQGKLELLNARIAEEKLDLQAAFPAGVLKSLYSGKKHVYGLPLQLEESFLYYRKSVFRDPNIRRRFFKQNGFELNPPTTWAEFNIVARFFDRRFNPDSPFPYGTTMSLLGYAFMEEFYFRQWAFNGRFLDKEKHLSVDSVENIRAVRSFQETYKTAHPDSGRFFFDEAYQALLTEEVPMIISFPVHCIPYLYKEADEEIELDIAATGMPGGRSLTGGWELCINAASEKKEQAFRFIQWTIREDMGVIRNILGSALPIKSTFDNALLGRIVPELRMMDPDRFRGGLREKILDRRGDPVDMTVVEAMVQQELELVLYQGKEAEKALADAQRALRAVLNETV